MGSFWKRALVRAGSWDFGLAPLNLTTADPRLAPGAAAEQAGIKLGG
jgi:hypothetical protein